MGGDCGIVGCGSDGSRMTDPRGNETGGEGGGRVVTIRPQCQLFISNRLSILYSSRSQSHKNIVTYSNHPKARWNGNNLLEHLPYLPYPAGNKMATSPQAAAEFSFRGIENLTKSLTQDAHCCTALRCTCRGWQPSTVPKYRREEDPRG